MPMVQAYAEELLNQKESGYDSGASYVSDTLFSATERLMSALDRLEHNVQISAGKQGEGVKEAEQIAFFEQENQVLRRERETLNATLEQLEAEYGDLQKVAGTIYKKLNESIRRLTHIIGN
jgi:predicted  nucleic acid-binding Zn-ribbon protein